MMLETVAVAPGAATGKFNGHVDPGAHARDASGIILRNGMPMAILPQAVVSAHAREAMIRTDAYFRAERRDFLPGHEIDDWLAAEDALCHLLAVP
jgi:hypothetical protein